MKLLTVHEVPPEVGGVTPDSKPGSWIIEVVGQVLVVGTETVRPARAEMINAKRMMVVSSAAECREMMWIGLFGDVSLGFGKLERARTLSE